MGDNQTKSKSSQSLSGASHPIKIDTGTFVHFLDKSGMIAHAILIMMQTKGGIMTQEQEEKTTQKRDYIEVAVFKTAKDFGFTYQVRWSAQKALIESLMYSNAYDNEPGIHEVRAMIDHSIRIKSQQEVQRLVAEHFNLKMDDFKGGNYSEYVKQLEPDVIQFIQGKMMDWQYDPGRVYMTDEEKALRAVQKALAKINPGVADLSLDEFKGLAEKLNLLG